MIGKMDEKEERDDCEEESEEEDWDEGWEVWTDPLEELGAMADAFKVYKLQGKTVLDVGTDGVKPLYLALKYEPSKIIGITIEKPRFASDIAENSKFLTKTEIHFYTCDFFEDICLDKILKKENVKDRFDFIFISKTLHHLRNGECIAADRRGSEHTCRKDEKCCIYEFKEEEIFKRFFQYGKKVIVYEWFVPHEKDADKRRGKGGHFTVDEWSQILGHLSRNYKVELFKPLRCHLAKNELEKATEKLRQVDYICFSVEEK